MTVTPTEKRIVLELSVPDALEVLNGLIQRRERLEEAWQDAQRLLLPTQDLRAAYSHVIKLEGEVRRIAFAQPIANEGDRAPGELVEEYGR